MAAKTLLDFDDSGRTHPVILTPRSLEACKIHGFIPDDLVRKNYSDFAALGISDDVQQKTADRYEARRKERLKLVRTERANIVGTHRPASSASAGRRNVSAGRSLATGSLQDPSIQSVHSLGGSGREATMIEREKKQLEKIQMRQQHELQQMLAYEIKRAELVCI